MLTINVLFFPALVSAGFLRACLAGLCCFDAETEECQPLLKNDERFPPVANNFPVVDTWVDVDLSDKPKKKVPQEGTIYDLKFPIEEIENDPRTILHLLVQNNASRGIV